MSYTGENGISEWMVPFFGATAYENKAVLTTVLTDQLHRVQKPRRPHLWWWASATRNAPPRSRSSSGALQHQGVTTQLVVYPGTKGTASSNPAHLRDVRERTVRWMDTYLKPAKP